MKQKKIGVLLINIGTPQSLALKDIKNFLSKFLNDPKVIDLPFLLRKLLVNGIIIPFRAKKTQAAYKEIWGKTHSPLIENTKKFQHKLAIALGANFFVAYAMSYSHPFIDDAMHTLINKELCDEIIILPLYPQYADATTGSVINAINNYVKKLSPNCNVKIISSFYDNKHYINALATIIAENLAVLNNNDGNNSSNNNNNSNNVNNKYDFLLFSYHGIPMRQIRKSGCNNLECNQDRKSNPCTAKNLANNNCYRYQCFATSTLVATKLNLDVRFFATAFQSRLGKIAWTEPYTIDTLHDLAKKGIKNLTIVCPSFIVDCLETLEEINIRARKIWSQLGGNRFSFIPALNDHNEWITAAKNIITIL